MKKIVEKIKKSSINYFSDLFIAAMVILWIGDAIYEALIASAVTISSIILSIQTGTPCFDTTMWSSIGTNIAVPLGAGGAIWMIKNGVQHAIKNSKGEICEPDFPDTEVTFSHELPEENEVEIATEEMED